MRSRSSSARRAAAALLIGLVASSCAGWMRAVPDLGGLYDRAARAEDFERNPVIVIPGILGSKLRDAESGRIVWGAFAGFYANPSTPDGARRVALPMREGVPLSELRDAVVPEGVLDRVRLSLFGLPVELAAYVHILATLGVGGYRDESLGRAGAVRYASDHFTCFQFDYDWRRDVSENARRFHEFVIAKKAAVRAELARRGHDTEREIRFDVIAHSMGGLLLRYYLRYGATPLPDDGSLPPLDWSGAEHVERAILIGTPNAGSAHALLELVEGASFSFVLPEYDPVILGTMPSIYQLLPRTRHRPVRIGDRHGSAVDLLDPVTWRRYGWGLAAADADAVLADLLPEVGDAPSRRRIALEHLDKSLARARQLHSALDRFATPPSTIRLHLFAGDAEETPAVLVVAPDSGELEVAEQAPGDGTVLRTSAVMDERVGQPWRPGVVSPIEWNGVTFVFADHLELTRDPAFTDNLLYQLLESPRPPLLSARAR